MTIEINEKERPKMGDTKTKTKFLWLPRILPNDSGTMQFRWLVTSTILYQYSEWKECVPEVGEVDVYAWRAMSWVDS